MFHIAEKDLKQFYTDKKAVLLIFILPIILISLFVIAFGGAFSDNKPRTTRLLIVDQDSTKTSSETIKNLESVEGLTIERDKYNTAKEKIKSGNRIGALVFHQGYADSVVKGGKTPVELFYDQSREIEVGFLQQALIPSLIKSVGQKSIKHKILQNTRKKYNLSEEFLGEIGKQIDSYFEGQKNTSDNSVEQYGFNLKKTGIIKKEKASWGLIQAVAGVAVMMLLFNIISVGSSVLEEKENGTLKRLLITPIKRSSILYEKLNTAMVISISQLIVMFIFAWLVFGLNISLDIPSLVVMILTTAFACSGFGLFLAAISKTRKQVESTSIIVILVMSAIGGSMVPLFLMPSFMQKLAMISVNYWSINGFYDIFWRELSFGKVVINALVLFGIGLVLTIISSYLFKRNILRIA